MEIDRRDFIKGTVIAGAVGVATTPTALQANNNMTNWLCVVVDSVDELTTDLKSSSDTVIVKDVNRGGIFIYDSDKSDINDGGIVFNGWVRQYENEINIKWFDVKCDGVTDDTEKLRALTKMIPNNTTIIINGICLVSSVAIDLKAKKNIKFMGNGKFISSFTRDYFFMVYQCENIEISGLSFSTIFEDKVWSDSDMLGARAIRIKESKNVKITQCNFSDIPFVGVVSFNSNDVNVSNNYFENMGGNCFSSDGDSSRGFVFNNNIVRGCYDSFVGTHQAKDIIISGNTLYKQGTNNRILGNSGYGIDIAGGQNVTITGNVIEASIDNKPNNYNTGLCMHIHKYLGTEAENITITGNIIKYGSGIAFTEGVDMAIVSNNTFLECETALSIKDNVKNLHINNNFFNKSNLIAIKGDVGAKKENIKIINNTIKNSQDYNITIYPKDSYTNLLIKNNDMGDANNYYDLSDTSYVSNNSFEEWAKA